MSLQFFYLLKEDGGYLLQENDRKIIIADGLAQQAGAGSGGTSKQVGHSLVKKQLGNRNVESIINYAKSNIAYAVSLHSSSKLKLVELGPTTGVTLSDIVLKESFNTLCGIKLQNNFETVSHIRLKEFAGTKAELLKNFILSMADDIKYIKEEFSDIKPDYKKIEKIAKLKKLYEIVKNIPINEKAD